MGMHTAHNPAKIDMASASPSLNRAGVNNGKAQANILRSTTVCEICQHWNTEMRRRWELTAAIALAQYMPYVSIK